MVLDVNELTQQAKQLLNNSTQTQQEQQPTPIETPAYVTKDEVAQVEVEAEKAIIASQQNAALRGQDEYVVEAFQEPASLHDIVKNKLSALTENTYTVEKLYKANLPNIEAMSRVLLTREAREAYADTYIAGINTQRDEMIYQSQLNQTTREALLRKHEIAATAKEFEESITKSLGKTGVEVLEALPADEYVNRVLDFKAEQKKLFEEWRSGKSAPVAQNVVAHKNYEQTAQEMKTLSALSQALSKYYPAQ